LSNPDTGGREDIGGVRWERQAKEEREKEGPKNSIDKSSLTSLRSAPGVHRGRVAKSQSKKRRRKSISKKRGRGPGEKSRA